MTKYIIGLMLIMTISSCATNDAVCDEETAPVTYTVNMVSPAHDSHYGFGDTIRFVGKWKKIVCRDTTAISEIEAGQVNRMNTNEDPIPRLHSLAPVTDTCTACTYWIVPDTIPAIAFFLIKNDWVGDTHRVYLNQ